MKIRLLFLLVFIFAFLQNADLFSQDSLLVWSKWLPDIYSARFSPDNTKISLLKDFSDIIILKIPSGEVEDTLKGVGHGEYTQDGKYLVCGSDKLRVFNANTYEQLDYFENDNKEVSEVSIAPDNKICSRHGGSGFRIWDFNTGKIIKRKSFGIIDSVNNISEGVTKLAYTKDGKYLIVNKAILTKDTKGNPILLDEYAMILDANSLDSIGVINTGKSFTGMVSSNTGRYLAYSFGERVRIYDFLTKSIVNNIVVITQGMKFSPYDKYIGLTGTGINIYNLLEKQPYYKYISETSTTELDFSMDNKYIFISTGGYVYLYRTPWITSVPVTYSTINATIVYPNPSENNIVLSFHIEKANITEISILDLLGNEIKIVQNSFLGEGDYQIPIDLSSLPNGNYFIHIESGNYSFSQNIIKNG
jgi:hypothetical protein